MTKMSLEAKQLKMALRAFSSFYNSFFFVIIMSVEGKLDI
jgi:hypothetical protein